MTRALAAALLLLLLPLPALAGTTGSITGVVVSAQRGTPIAGTRIRLSSRSYEESTVTDARGFFSLVSVPAGTYSISYVHPGYNPASRTVLVAADTSRRADFALMQAFIDIAAIRRLPTLAEDAIHLSPSVTILSPHVVPNFESLTFAQQLQFAPGIVP